MRVVFMGTGEIALPTLDHLLAHPRHELVAVFTQPDRPVGRHQELTPPQIKVIAEKHGIPVFQPEKLRKGDSIETLREMDPDLIVVMAYGQILPKAVLDLPKIACLNLHASLLPKYRGAAPIQAAILNGDAETGITLMYMAEGLDTGDMLCMDEIAIAENETGGSLHDRLALLAPETLEKGLQLLESGTAPRTPQDDSQASHVAKLSRDSGRIDWRQNCHAIERQIRAMHPWPSCFTTLELENGKRQDIKVHKANVESELRGKPAAVLRADNEGIIVACSEGAILLEVIQPLGKRKMHSREFLAGNRVKTQQ